MLRYGWATNKQNWDAVPSEMVSASWTKIKFVSDSNVLVPAKRGVYLVEINAGDIFSGSDLGNYASPIYTGHSTNLHQRFRQHVRGNTENNISNKVSEFRNCLYFCFATFDDRPKDELKALEQSLIEVFGPPLNSINSLSKGVVTEDGLKGSLVEERNDA
jgi:hypothetical protein